MFSMLPRLPPNVSIVPSVFVLFMYLSRSSLAKLVRVEVRESRNDPLMTRSADTHPRWLGRVRAPLGGGDGMIVFKAPAATPPSPPLASVLIAAGAVLIRSALVVWSLFMLLESEWFKGLGGRPSLPVVTLSCWNDRVNVFFGVVGGTGVRLDSLPLRDEVKLFEELAPYNQTPNTVNLSLDQEQESLVKSNYYSILSIQRPQADFYDRSAKVQVSLGYVVNRRSSGGVPQIRIGFSFTTRTINKLPDF